MVHFMEFYQTKIRLIFAFYCSMGFIVGMLSGTNLQRFMMLHNRIFTCIPDIHNPS